MYYLKKGDSYIMSTMLPKQKLDEYTIITQEEYEVAMRALQEEEQNHVSN